MNTRQRTSRGQATPTPRVLFAEIASTKEFVTRGNGVAQKVLVGPVFQDIGPQLQDIVVHVFGQQATANFTYKILAEYSYDGELWAAFGAALVTVTAGNVNKYTLSAPYTTRADFGRHLRFLVEVNDNATAVEAAQLSVSVAFRFLP